jgi:DNA-binding MarR family transcriptional regulator
VNDEREPRKKIPPVIIPGWLDDAGLRPSVFRVYCRVQRRGDCFEGLENIAEACHLRRVTVQTALKELVRIGLITAEFRSGKQTIYRAVIDPPQKKHYL